VASEVGRALSQATRAAVTPRRLCRQTTRTLAAGTSTRATRHRPGFGFAAQTVRRRRASTPLLAACYDPPSRILYGVRALHRVPGARERRSPARGRASDRLSSSYRRRRGSRRRSSPRRGHISYRPWRSPPVLEARDGLKDESATAPWRRPTLCVHSARTTQGLPTPRSNQIGRASPKGLVEGADRYPQLFAAVCSGAIWHAVRRGRSRSRRGSWHAKRRSTCRPGLTAPSARRLHRLDAAVVHCADYRSRSHRGNTGVP